MSPITRNMHKETEFINRRITYVLMLSSIILIVIVFRLIYLQIFSVFSYDKICSKVNTIKFTDKAERGDILDRNGYQIATSIKSYNLYVIKPLMQNKKRTAEVISDCGVLTYDIIMSRLNSRMNYIPVAFDISEQSAKLLKNSYSAIVVKEEKTRYYNKPHSFSNITGFVGIDNNGLEGLEYLFNKRMKGKDGYMIYQKKPNGKIYKHPDYADKKAEKGNDIVLTIDAKIQEIAYNMVEEYCQKYNALHGNAIIMDVSSGEILGMVDYPSYNSNLHGKENPAVCRNWNIVNMYEPGSVFKIVPTVAALEKKIIKLDDICKDSRDTIVINGKRITDAHNLDILTFKQAFIMSSNIAYVNIGEKVGKANVYDMALRLGFGKKSNLGLPGEQRGFISDYEKWIPIHFANICFGQGVSVTSIQILSAYNVIANDGVYVNPKIIKSVDGKMFTKNLEKRVINRRTSEIMNELLKEVVDNGTAIKAGLDGISVAGKTGTAEKVGEFGGYQKGRYISSFVGYLPADNPKFIILTIIDEPKGMYWASEIAAPLFSDIAKRIINLPEYRYIILEEKEHVSNETGKPNKKS